MRKKLLAVLACLTAVAAGIFCFRAVSIRADTADIPIEIYTQNQNWGHTVFQLEDEGDYYYQTLAKTRTSSTVHVTFAIEFSRIKDGINPLTKPYITNTEQCSEDDPHFYRYTGSTDVYNAYKGYERDSFVIYRFNEMKVKEEEYVMSNGYTLMTWKIDHDTVWDNIRENPEWYNELQAHINEGTPYYFGIDSVKTYCTGVPQNASDLEEYMLYSHGMLKDGDTKQYRGTVFTWANWNTSYAGYWTNLISDYYNHYYVWGSDGKANGGSNLIPDGIFTLTKNNDTSSNTSEGKSNTSIGAESGDTYSAPGIYTYNESSVFDVGVAIPTTEDYNNHVEEDAWYGSSQISKYTYKYEQTLYYKVHYTFTEHGTSMSESPQSGKEYSYILIIPSSDLSSTTVLYVYDEYYTISKTTGTYPVKSIWTGSYYCVTNINLFQCLETRTLNNCTEPPTTTYHSNADVSYDVTINGKNVSTGMMYIDSLAPEEEEHVIFHEDQLDTSTMIFDVTARTEDEAIAAVGSQPQDEADRRIKYNDKLITLINDEFTVNGATYLDDTGCHYFEFVDLGTHEMVEADGTLPGGTQSDVITDSKSVHIPKEMENGEYYTDISATYQRFINSSQLKTITISDIADHTKKAILSAYAANEPVVVHSPVIAPITIKGEDTTQLINTELQDAGVTELKLDGSYVLHFDQIQYFPYKGYDVFNRLAGYIKYVEKKSLKFPFSVCIDGAYYETMADGYTDWIVFPADTTDVNIYIPSWTKEGVYGVSGYHGYDAVNRPIKVKCSANNYQDWMADLAQEYEYNSELANYEATFDYPVQISGHIYDFQAVSVRDYFNWATADWEDKYGYGVYNFASLSETSAYQESEKKTGAYNRLGLSYVRHTVDGYQTDAWSSANTLPFATGASGYDSSKGYLVRGNTFAFTFKTIANLDGEDSYVKITPTYRYVDMSGNVYESDQIKLYYDSHNDYYIEYGSQRDKDNAMDLSIYDIPDFIYFDDALYDYHYDTTADTAALEGITENQLTHKTAEKASCLSSITMPSALRLLTGNEEELAVNMKDVNDADSVKRYHSSNSGAVSNIYAEIGSEEYTDFKASMQTWYGRYTIPSSIKVCMADADISQYDALDGTEDIWMKDGYLVLNFRIETYRDGDNAHLTYYSSSTSNTNMWHLEQFGTSGGTEQDRYVAFPANYVTSIPMRDGDVAIIPLSADSVDEHYTEGLLYAN